MGNQPSVQHIPIDLMVEILCKLPLASIGSLKVVCKEWHSMLLDPQVLHEICRTHSLATKLFFLERYCLRKYVAYNSVDCGDSVDEEEVTDNVSLQHPFGSPPSPFAPLRSYFDVIGSYNGLVALSYYFGDHRIPRRFFLWNPITHECKDVYSRILLHSERLRLYGLCYDASCNEYSVVIADSHSYYDVNVTIYVVSLKTASSKSWCCRDEWVKPKMDYCRTVGMVICGVPHWTVESRSKKRWTEYFCKNPSGVRPTKQMILYFDIKSRKFKRLRVPHHIGAGGARRILGLAALDGQRELGIVVHHQEPPYSTELWVMKDYGKPKSWVHAFLLPSPCTAIQRRQQPLKFMDVLGFLPNGEILVHVKYSDEATEIRAFDLHNEASPRKILTWRRLLDIDITVYEPSLAVCGYHKTFVPNRWLVARG